jgi:hypothetical protein
MFVKPRQLINMKMINQFKLIKSIVGYNLKIVFADKFVYFLIAAIAFYLMIIGIMLFSDDVQTHEDIFNTIIFPGILIIFYPVVFNIQNDKDARMIEIVFGVPDYRYKVYLIRFAISILLLLVILIVLAWFSDFAITHIPVFKMVYELMFPLFFLACTSFLFSTLIKNGRGTAVVMVIIGLIFFILSEPLQYSKWNIFLNPFNVPGDISMGIWMNVVFQNRLMLMVGSVIALLWSMINLQKRESFV